MHPSRLKRGNNALENSLRTVAETEDVAAGINSELERNRDKIQSARSKVKQVDSLAGSARGIILGMAHREKRQKSMIYFLMFFMFCAIIVALYYVVTD